MAKKVKRTYTTGISFAHIPRDGRKAARHRLARIVDDLSRESMDYCGSYIDDVVEYYIGIKDPRVNDQFDILDTNSGKFGVNAIMTHLNTKYKENKPKAAANHLHGAMHLLAGNSKVYYSLMVKLQEAIQWMTIHPVEMMNYLLWGRSDFLNKSFAKYWKVQSSWVDNIMFGVWKRFYETRILDEILPKVDLMEFIPELDRLIVETQAMEQTEARKKFLKRLHYIKNNATKLDLRDIPSHWDPFRQWITNQQLSKYKTDAWASVVRSVISRVYVSRNEYETLINTLGTAKMSDLLNKPFTNKSKQLPYLMVSGPKYVVRRKKNVEALQDMRTKGYFELSFKELDRKVRWKDALTLRVRASHKMRELLKHDDLNLLSMIILPPKGRTRDVDIRLIFEAPLDVFISTNHLNQRMLLNQRKQLAIDINRRGKYAVVSSFNLPIPAYIDLLNQRWSIILDEIRYYQGLVDRGIKTHIYNSILDLLHLRKIHLRKEYHILLANFVGQQMVSADARTLIVEGLETSTKGNKGALAKAIESMPDDIALYVREVYALKLFTKKRVRLHTENPRGSSKYHVGCGGVLQRDKTHYDIAPCKKCGKMVNTHHNAALYIEAKYLKSDPHDTSCLKKLRLKTPIGS